MCRTYRAKLISKSRHHRHTTELERTCWGYVFTCGGFDVVARRRIGRDPSPVLIPDRDLRGEPCWVLIGSRAMPVKVRGKLVPGTNIHRLRHGDTIELCDGTVVRFVNRPGGPDTSSSVFGGARRR